MALQYIYSALSHFKNRMLFKNARRQGTTQATAPCVLIMETSKSLSFMVELLESGGKVIVSPKWIINISCDRSFSSVLETMVDHNYHSRPVTVKIGTKGNESSFVEAPVDGPIHLLSYQGQKTNMVRYIIGSENAGVSCKCSSG